LENLNTALTNFISETVFLLREFKTSPKQIRGQYIITSQYCFSSYFPAFPIVYSFSCSLISSYIDVKLSADIWFRGFEKPVLRKILILGTTTRNWRKRHKEKLRSFYFSLQVFSAFISRTIGWLVIGQLLERKEINTGL